MQAKVIAIANQKGGVGKTTTTLSLGAALARKGLQVLMLDLDPHICASVHMRFYPDAQALTLLDIFMAPSSRQPRLWSQIISRNEGQICDFAPGSVRLGEIETDLKDRPGKGMILKMALQSQLPRYDYILLDCPPHMGLIMANALVACDLLIIPIQTDFLALHGLKLLFDTLNTLNKVLPRPVRYRAVPTMYDMRARACRRVLELMQQKMGNAIFKTIIGVDTRFREASALGCTIFDIDARSRGAQCYEALAGEVLELW